MHRASLAFDVDGGVRFRTLDKNVSVTVLIAVQVARQLGEGKPVIVFDGKAFAAHAAAKPQQHRSLHFERGGAYSGHALKRPAEFLSPVESVDVLGKLLKLVLFDKRVPAPQACFASTGVFYAGPSGSQGNHALLIGLLQDSFRTVGWTKHGKLAA